MGDDGIAHQIVHQQHGGALDGFERLDRQQLRVARAYTDQVQVPGALAAAVVAVEEGLGRRHGGARQGGAGGCKCVPRGGGWARAWWRSGV